MTTSPNCPSSEDLQRFLLGQLPAEESERIQQHLAECQRCLGAVAPLQTSDSLIEAIRAQAGAASRPEAEVVEKLIDKLDGLVAGNTSTISDTIDRPVTETPGTQIGPYKLLQQIGEGGFGIVFMAEQVEPVRRRVALKVIKPGMDTRQVIARFEAERQALAVMDHPHIARVLDAGATESGRPYFVMELVRGVPITKYCDENSLPVRERLALFATVCQAIQHAHTKGIIHRDIKPTNVLVTRQDGQPLVKVIDFGVAKAMGQQLTDKTLFTEFAQMIGTPLYMSPEQAELSSVDIDTRSDIYSLGVLLYELLTGTTPVSQEQLKKAAFDEIRRIIREEEPPKPSTRISSAEAAPSIAAVRSTEPAKLSKQVRGELDWIVMKALEKDRNRRYETANGLAMDVQRYLSDEPVLACPPSAGYRLRKFVRRNKRPVLAVCLVLLALVVGIIGTTAGMLWAVRERDDKAKALTAERKERKDKEKALAAEIQARDAEKQAHDRAIAALRDMTDDIVEKQLARGTTLTEENKEFLRKIIKHFEGFAAITGNDGYSRAIRAEGYYRVGLVRYRLGELKDAETAWRDALAIWKRLAVDFPALSEIRDNLARVHNNLGALLNGTGRLKEAESAFADALAIFKRLAADFPARSDFRHGVARSLNNLGQLFSETGRLGPAEAAYIDSLAIRKQLAADFPARPEFRQDLAACHNCLGYLFSDTSRLAQAEAAHIDALAIRKQLAAEFPAHPEFRRDLADSHNNLGTLFYETDRLAEAEAAYKDALAIQKQLAADFPARPQFRQELAAGLNNLGNVLGDTGQRAEAEAAYKDALAMQKQLAADFPTQPDIRNQLVNSLVNLARLCNQQREFVTAKAYLAEALPHHRAALTANPRNLDYQDSYRHNLMVLVVSHAGDCDQSAALQVAQKLHRLGSSLVDAYYAARALSLCMPVVQGSDQLTQEQRDKAVQIYGDEAMKMLRDAVAKGYKDAEQMKKDTDLDALREREDFKTLLAALEATNESRVRNLDSERKQ